MRSAIGYTHQGVGIPPHIAYALEAYAREHREVGHFLTAVLENDLAQAVGRADSRSFAALRTIVVWLYNEAPPECYGSKEKVEAWLADREVITPFHEPMDSMRREAMGLKPKGSRDHVTFNTGRQYGPKGQRIAACFSDTGGIVFVDVDRNIAGYIRPDCVKLHEFTLKQEDVMWAYDHNNYELAVDLDLDLMVATLRTKAEAL